MNTNNIDFGYLIEQMYLPIGETYTQVIDRYEDLPMCLMACIDNGNHSEHIRVDFNETNGSVFYFFNKDRMLDVSSLCLQEPSAVELFVVFLLRYADYHDYMKNHWVIKERFFLAVKEEDYCTHFICRKFVNC